MPSESTCEVVLDLVRRLGDQLVEERRGLLDVGVLTARATHGLRDLRADAGELEALAREIAEVDARVRAVRRRVGRRRVVAIARSVVSSPVVPRWRRCRSSPAASLLLSPPPQPAATSTRTRTPSASTANLRNFTDLPSCGGCPPECRAAPLIDLSRIVVGRSAEAGSNGRVFVSPEAGRPVRAG